MTDDITLRVQNVTKRFGDFTAVDDLSFNVRRGRVFGFLGPNGAGKTTTIRMIVGITAPDSGEIKYDFLSEPPPSGGGQFANTDSTTSTNTSPTHATTAAFMDRIGYLPEERGLYKKLKIVDQLRYFAALKDVPAKEADKRIDFWLDRMGLAEWKLKKTSDLSKGMQQKIQFISTVLHDPDLLILDEPFSGLDPVNVEFMIDVLSEFRTKDKTVIFSTHQMETAERLCSDISDRWDLSRRDMAVAEVRRGEAHRLRGLEFLYGRDVQFRAVDQARQLKRRRVHAGRVVHDKLCGQIAEARTQPETVARTSRGQD